MKRKFSLLVAAACLFSSLTFGGVAHADSPSTFTDVTNKTQYYEGIMTLTKLGIINGYTEDNGATYSFKPDGEITRAEFSKIIITALGAGAAAGDSDKFKDINNHWAKGFIIAAADRGIVNGMGDGTFEPDSKVTYEQAVKMIVCAAGYEKQGLALGGWPKGYLAQADNLAITKNAVSANSSSPASRGIIAQLMYNVLEVEIPEYDITGNLKDELKTFMETYLGIVKEKATIVGVEDKVLASFQGTLYLDEMAVKLRNGDIVTMDYTTYFEDKAEIEERLGQEAVVYYRLGKSGALNTLYAIDFESGKNTVTVVGNEDIDSYNDGTLKYYDKSDKLKTLNIDLDRVSVYYNGKLVNDAETALDAYLEPSLDSFFYGEVKFTDSGSDKSIDIVEITDYEFMVVSKTPSTTDYKVTNKVRFTNGNEPEGYIPSIALDPESITYESIITNASGKEVAVTSLKVNDVLLIALSEDETIRTVKVCSTPVTGKITGESSNNTITINGKEHKISDFAQKYFDDNDIKTETGSQGTYYVDIFGTIVYATQSEVSKSTSPYVYIIKVIKDDNDENKATLTAYVPSANAVKQYTMAGKIRFNGSNKSVESIVEILRGNKDSGSAVVAPDAHVDVYGSGNKPHLSNVSQVARLTINGSEVEEIVVADISYNDYEKSTEDKMTIKPYLQLTGKTTYKGANNFDGKFYVNSSTTFIYVPQDRSDTKSYAKKSISSFSGSKQYWVQPYNVNSSRVADLVIVYGKETQTITVKEEAAVWLLASNHSIEFEDDEEIYNVTYFNSAEKATNKKSSVSDNKNVSDVDYKIKDLSAISVGDFFRAGTDSETGLVNAELVVDYDDVKAAIKSNCDFTGLRWWSDAKSSDSHNEVLIANVIDVLEDNGKYSLRVTADGFVDGALPETNERLIAIDSAIIYRVSKDGEEITPYVEGSDSEKITPDTIKGAKLDGTSASKIGMYLYTSSKGNTKTCKMILIYE